MESFVAVTGCIYSNSISIVLTNNNAQQQQKLIATRDKHQQVCFQKEEQIQQKQPTVTGGITEKSLDSASVTVKEQKHVHVQK